MCTVHSVHESRLASKQIGSLAVWTRTFGQGDRTYERYSELPGARLFTLKLGNAVTLHLITMPAKTSLPSSSQEVQNQFLLVLYTVIFTHYTHFELHNYAV